MGWVIIDAPGRPLTSIEDVPAFSACCSYCAANNAEHALTGLMTALCSQDVKQKSPTTYPVVFWQRPSQSSDEGLSSAWPENAARQKRIGRYRAPHRRRDQMQSV